MHLCHDLTTSIWDLRNLFRLVDFLESRGFRDNFHWLEKCYLELVCLRCFDSTSCCHGSLKTYRNGRFKICSLTHDKNMTCCPSFIGCWCCESNTFTSEGLSLESNFLELKLSWDDVNCLWVIVVCTHVFPFCKFVVFYFYFYFFIGWWKCIFLNLYGTCGLCGQISWFNT